MMAFEFVRNKRKELGLTQQQLATKADLSLYVVKRFEANRPYNPLIVQVEKLAKAFHVTVDFLLLELTWPSKE
ncbi:helix-turn-helix domain-containing protein [Brevibacillus fluminis]|uniref:helix-turn-helix domain-containing protein n=1 Tax=Brevibacillus fluminis TaxID=511487 RepID=UPI003F8C100C